MRRMALRLSPLLALPFALVATSASGATPSRMVPVRVAISGVGIVNVGLAQIPCRHAWCSTTLLVRQGTSVVLRARGQTGAKVTWSSGCKAAASACTLLITKATRIAVTFIRLGAKTNPIPLGTSAEIDPGNWSLKIVSVTPDATSQLARLGATAPLSGQQDYLINVSASASGPLVVLQLAESVFALGKIQAYAAYNWCGVVPPPNLLTQGTYPDSTSGFTFTSAGQTITGNMCFVVDKDDASSLLLYTEPPVTNANPNPDGTAPTPDQYAVWFALH